MIIPKKVKKFTPEEISYSWPRLIFDCGPFSEDESRSRALTIFAGMADEEIQNKWAEIAVLALPLSQVAASIKLDDVNGLAELAAQVCGFVCKVETAASVEIPRLQDALEILLNGRANDPPKCADAARVAIEYALASGLLKQIGDNVFEKPREVERRERPFVKRAKSEWTATAVCAKFNIPRSTLQDWNVWKGKDEDTQERIVDRKMFFKRFEKYKLRNKKNSL